MFRSFLVWAGPISAPQMFRSFLVWAGPGKRIILFELGEIPAFEFIPIYRVWKRVILFSLRKKFGF